MLHLEESIIFSYGGSDPAHHHGVEILLDEIRIHVKGRNVFRLQKQTEPLLKLVDRAKLETLKDVKDCLGWERARLV